MEEVSCELTELPTHFRRPSRGQQEGIQTEGTVRMKVCGVDMTGQGLPCDLSHPQILRGQDTPCGFLGLIPAEEENR